MKIDSIDNIVNKEKSPDKAERTSATIEDIKKTQSKFFDYTNDLAATTANCGANNALLLDDTGTSKLKKLLLNSNPEVANLNELTNNGITNVNNNINHSNHNNGVKSDEHQKIRGDEEVIESKPPTTFAAPPKSEKQKLFLCSECNEYFLKLHLFNHMKCVHNKFTCLYCYGFFEKIEKLQQHLVRKHKVQNTAFFDEQTLKSCFSGYSAISAGGGSGDKVINAVCCKCATIFNISENNFYTHQCGGTNKSVAVASGKSAALNSKRKNSVAVQQQQQQVVENSLITNHRNSISTAKEENSYHEQAIPQLIQEPATPRTTFNGALSELSSQQISNNVPPTPTSPVISNSKDANASSSINTSTSSMSWNEQPSHQDENIEDTSKQVVPKLTLKIPKAAFNHQQDYDNIESEEDSGEESDDESDGSSESENNDERKSSSLSENDDKENEVRRPENLPLIKLKFKNLSSTPELVHENNLTIPPPSHEFTTPPGDVDLSECPMDLEPENQQLQQQQQNQQEELSQILEEPKKIIIDGIEIKPANEDIRPIDIMLDEALDKINVVKFMKICLRASFPYCLYCNHARKIVVNGKSLAIHFITHHRFHAMVDSITAEELHPEKIINKFESSVDELNSCFFNLETYDDHDELLTEGHVTVSHDKLYECFQCRFQTPIHKELYLHNRKMHAKSPINCLMCKMCFYSYSELLCHICPGVTNKQEYNEFRYYCCLCNKTNITSAFRLMVHLRKHHSACDVCLEKCCDQGKLSSHVWKHKLMHICFRCHVFYQNKADITKHLFWKHGTEGIECKKCLQKKWPHVYHFCIPPAVFTCNQCEMTFTKAVRLRVHKRLHEDGSKYPCTEVLCEKKFISKKLLIRHLERHQSEIAATENGEGERSAEGTVIIPKEIPEGFCTRIMPVVFKRFIKKPAVRKFEDETKNEEKVEEIKKEEPKEVKVKKLPDLPETTKLNLSESSDSENSSDDEKDKKSPMPAIKSNPQSPKIKGATEKPEKPKKESSLTDSESDDERKENKSETSESMKNIMENLKSFQESQQPSTTNLENEEKKFEDTKLEDEDSPEDTLPENPIIHVVQSDHDYAKMYRPAPGTTTDDLEDMIKSQTIEKEKNKKKDAKSPLKDKTKKKKNEDFSSSDSSSGSSSDSSSGSSSDGSSSSGSSSTSTSDSSSSEASSLNTSKPRTKKFTKKRSKKEKKIEPDIPEEPEIPRDPDDIIYDSDLLTDETDTDEEFYDQHPLMFNQQNSDKNKRLGLVEGIIENSRPSTPSLPPEETPKLKIKKRKHRKSFSSPSKRNRNEYDGDFSPVHRHNKPLIHTSTPVPKIELHQANQIRQLLQSTQQQPVLPILKEQQQPQVSSMFPVSTPINVSRVTSSAASSRMNSGDEAGIKRSQRKRVPNKFYGYTSDDDSMAVHVQNPNDPFKPIPPPNLTWRKEDLPSRSKSPPPKVAPLKLNLTEPPQINDFDLSTTQLSVAVNHVNNIKSDDTASSGDDQLFISEPRKRKRKTQSQSMYAFHTLETPPTVSQPPIPRLKLTIGSNNKIRRRNINPLKPPAKKRKIANTQRPTFNPKQFDSQLPARIMQSPPPFTPEVVTEPMTSRNAHERFNKQQKLETAIQNTQLYFQRYNHAQVGSADVSQDISTEGDGRVYCYCRRPYDEQQGMIGCDGANCPIEWFHFECVGILVPPRGSWYCPECQKEQHQQTF